MSLNLHMMVVSHSSPRADLRRAADVAGLSQAIHRMVGQISLVGLDSSFVEDLAIQDLAIRRREGLHWDHRGEVRGGSWGSRWRAHR